MARPIKQGLDYYPRDVNFLRDMKFRKVRKNHGPISVMVYEALLDLIYSDKGYYLTYDEKSKDDVIWVVSECLQGKYQPSLEKIAEIIDDLVDCELFSECHFKSKIITSKRIQSTYYSATVDRKAIYIDFDIWMLSESEMFRLSRRSVILQNFVNRPNNSINRPNNEVNQPNNPQSKVKESKVKESKNMGFDGYGFSERLKTGIEKWLKYKTEQCDEYTPTAYETLLSEINNKLSELSEDQIIASINNSMACTYKGITWIKTKGSQAITAYTPNDHEREAVARLHQKKGAREA